jgi:hypothetical protein
MKLLAQESSIDYSYNYMHKFAVLHWVTNKLGILFFLHVDHVFSVMGVDLFLRNTIGR